MARGLYFKAMPRRRPAQVKASRRAAKMKSLSTNAPSSGRGRQETAFQRERQYLDRCFLLRQVSPPAAKGTDIPAAFGAKGFADKALYFPAIGQGYGAEA